MFNQRNFESHLLQITPENLKLLRKLKVSQFLRFSEVTFQNLSIFWSIFYLNDAIRCSCDVTNLTSLFMIQYQEHTYVQI